MVKPRRPRHGQYQRSVRSQHTVQIEQEGLRLANVLQYFRAQNVVEAVIGVRERVATVVRDIGPSPHSEVRGRFDVHAHVLRLRDELAPWRLAGAYV